MEFVNPEEVNDLLDEFAIDQVADGPDRMYLEMADGDGVVHMHLKCSASNTQPRDGATVMSVDKDKLPQLLEQMIHCLHLSQVVLVPVGKWRKVFDAVAFSMAQNADEHVARKWQEVDAAATVELNSRDPLLCEPADFHILIALMQNLLRDAESPDQGLALLGTASPVLVEVIPDGAVRVSLGSQVLADELSEAFAN